MQNEVIVLDTLLPNSTPSFHLDTFGKSKLLIGMIHSAFLHEKINLLNTALASGGRQSTVMSSAPEPNNNVPNPLAQRDTNTKIK